MKYIGFLIVAAGLVFFLVKNKNSETEMTDSKPKVEQASTKPAFVQNVPLKSKTIKKSAQKTDLVLDYPFDVNLRDADGNVVNTSEILKKGRTTVLLFWLTTCPPCKVKFQTLEKKYAEWQKEADFDVVAISVDFPKNGERFSQMVKEKDWPWPTYWDYERNFRNIMPSKLNGLPQEFVFDKNGKQVYYKKGFRPGYEEELLKQIKKYAK